MTTDFETALAEAAEKYSSTYTKTANVRPFKSPYRHYYEGWTDGAQWAKKHFETERDLQLESLLIVACQMREALIHSKAAMAYAYEDHSDQYYLNTSETIVRAIEAFDAWNSGEK